ncbi:hypothetical protein Tco_1095569, partial [Tanacetum coccineum]
MESSKTELEKGKLEDAVSYATTRIQIKRDAEDDPHSAYSQVSMRRQTRELIQIDGLTNDEVKSHLQVSCKASSQWISLLTSACRSRVADRRLPTHHMAIQNAGTSNIINE